MICRTFSNPRALSEARDQRVPRILGFQNSRDGRATIAGILNLGRRRRARLPLVGIVAVKARDAIKIVREIGEKFGRAGDLSVT